MGKSAAIAIVAGTKVSYEALRNAPEPVQWLILSAGAILAAWAAYAVARKLAAAKKSRQKNF